MNSPINEIAIAVLKKPLQDCSLDELKRLTDQFPYFAPAELLLAKKMQQENSSSYEEQVQKTSLYFQNRLWLDHLLNNTNGSATVIENRQVIEEKKEVEEEPQPIVTENKEADIVPGTVKEEMPEQTEPLAISPGPEPVIELPENDRNEMQAAGEVKEPVADQPGTPVEMPQLKIEPVTGGQDFVFEPYHTVDYFASQGIRFKEEDRPKDRFDQQLKSFTEWLKAMKRIPVTQVSVPGDTNQDKKVEQMAEHSIAERHIITEAMAEVWIKQGNKTKAEEIYRKLSLLDPPKSAYFAAKIEDLKKTS